MTLSKGEMDGLVRLRIIEWGEGVVRQAAAIRVAFNDKMAGEPDARIALTLAEHFFLIAANHFFRFANEGVERKLVDQESFERLQRFERDVRELRDMREHVLEYWKGRGRYQPRFEYSDPDSIRQYGQEMKTLPLLWTQAWFGRSFTWRGNEMRAVRAT
jgi:hypothetical protein